MTAAAMPLGRSVPARVAIGAWRFATAPIWTRRIGLIGIVAITLLAILAPLVSPYDPTALNTGLGLTPPSLEHPFGTDQLGRDVFARVLYGARIDLQIGAIGVAIPLVIGVIVGLIAGYYSGWLDVLIGRVIDVVVAFPFLVLVIAIVAMLGPGLVNFYIAVSLVSWVAYARIVRGETLLAKRREYVLAARSLGYRDVRIMFRHILPNVVAPTFVFGMSDFVLDILAGASLGFFGLGVPTPTPEWGVMIAEGRNFIITAPWVVVFPGLAIVVVGFFFSLLGDSLADQVRRVDPR
jgi:peptide/nickel transport system permease protein